MWNKQRIVKSNKPCVICGEQESFIDPFCYHPMCAAHEQYSHVVNFEIIQKQIGFIKVLPERFKKCQICNCELTQLEIDSLNEMDFVLTCKKHDEVRSWLNFDIAKKWIHYKENINKDATLIPCRFKESFFYNTNVDPNILVPPRDFEDWCKCLKS